MSRRHPEHAGPARADDADLFERLRASEARYRVLVEQASDAIAIVGPDGRIRDINAAGLAMLGYAAGELAEMAALDLADPEDVAANPPDYAKLVAGGTLLNRRRLRRRDGSTFPAESSTRLLDDGCVHIIIRDVSERVRREEELEKESSRLQLLKDLAVAANQSTDAERTFAVCLERVCSSAGWALGHVYERAGPGSDAGHLVPTSVWHPSDEPRHAAFREATLRTSLRTGEGLPGRVLLARLPEWIEDFDRGGDPRRGIAREAGLCSAAAFPVLVGEEVVAVLEFFAEAPRPADSRLLDVMRHAGAQLGRAWERRRADEALREVTDRMNLALQSARIGTWSWDVRSSSVVWEDYVLPLFGLEEGAGPTDLRELVDLVHPDDRQLVEREIEDAIRGDGSFEFEFRVTWPDGSPHALMCRGNLHFDASGHPTRITGVSWDVTERRRAEEQIRELAYFDPLTGLANRTLFQERLSGAVARARERGRLSALLFFDLDDFKDVNDTLGHDAGDALLQQVARRLLSIVRLQDFVARPRAEDLPAAISRLGGDEFTVLLGEIAAPEDAARVAARILQSFSHPFQVAGQEIFTRASIGIAVSPDDGEDAATLLRNADTAMYHAKRHDRGGYMFYDRSMNEAAARRREIEARLRRALENDGFALHYQPILEARSRRVLGAEALIRLADDEGISPAEFIPVAEDSGLIGPLGDWVLRSACREAQRWRREGFEPLQLAVNVSGQQLRQRDFTSRVVDALLGSRTPPERLVLEITESVIMQDDLVTNRSLRDLHEIGVSLALDDFGTGYSSLSYMRRFPLERLKIDRSFVNEVATNENDAALTGAILQMARRLGVRTVAEGVERQEQVEFLLAHGCDEFQGYLFSRPVPADAFLDYVRKQGMADTAD